MRRTVLLVPAALLAAGVLLLEIRIDRRPVVALAPDAQIVSPRGDAAVVRADLGPQADPGSLRLVVNGEDVTRRVRFTGEGRAEAHVDGLRGGVNQVVVSVRDRGGDVYRRSLDLTAPGAPAERDLSAELRETARAIMQARQAARRSPSTPQRVFEAARAGLDAVERLEEARARGREAPSAPGRIGELARELDASLPALRAHYRRTRRGLEDRGLDAKAERLDAVESTALAAARHLAAALERASSGSPADVAAAREVLEAITQAPPLPPTRPISLPAPPPLPDGQSPLDYYARTVSGQALSSRDPARLLEEPVPPPVRRARARALELGVPRAHAQTGDPDLDPGTGVRFDPADPDDPIVKKAAELGNDPVALYEFVRNEVEFELYNGMARGARATLLARRGNSADQAALLVALLRASGYKARFVIGDILVETDRAISWLNVRSREGAERLLAIQQFAPHFETDGGQEVLYVHDTYWVKARVPYGPDRGRSLDAAERWVFLDPSFTRHATRPGIDLPLVPFDAGLGSSGFLGSVQARTPIETWSDDVRSALRAAHPGKTLADMGVRGPIEPVELGMLPPALPYRPVQFHAEFADVDELPFVPFSPPGDVQPQDFLAPRLILDLRQTDGTTVLVRHEVRAADYAHQRVTIGWKGATPADQTLIDTDCQGDVALCPDPALVDVVPVVREEGVDTVTGTIPVTLGDTLRVYVANVDAQQFALCVNSSGNDPDVYLFTDPCYYNEQSSLVAGGRVALAFDTGQSSQALLDERTANLVEAYRAIGASHPGQVGFPLPEAEWESLVGELLYIGVLRYGQRFAQQGDVLEDISRFWSAPNGRGQAQSLVSVGFLSETPVSIVPAGLLIDILYVTGVFGIDTTEDPAARDQAFRLLGYTGSTLEHQLWEELTQFESVSTIKGLQWVQDNPGFGASVVTLSSPADPIPSLLPGGIRTRIQGELDAGKTVLVPDRPITVGLWTGVVYLAELFGAEPTASFIITTTGFANGGIAVGSFPLVYTPPRNTAIGASPDLIRILDPINVASGNVDHSRVDLEMPTRGLRPVRLERTYNSQLQEVGPFGFGWTHSYHHYLEAIDEDADGTAGEPEDTDGVVSGVAYVDGAGAHHRFRITAGNPGNGTFAPEPGNSLHLEIAGGVPVLREKDGTAWSFGAFGAAPSVGTRKKLFSVDDPAGNRTRLAYGPWGVTQVTDPLGRALSFTYDGSGHVIQVDDWSGRSWEYVYAGDDLVEMRDPQDAPLGLATERYQYWSNQLNPDNDHNLKRHEDGNGNGVTFYYYQNDKAYKQVDDEGAETRLSYDVFRLETIEIDPLGHRQTYQYDAGGQLKRMVRKDGAVEDYVYDPATRNLQQVLDVLGDATTWTYDAFGNVKTVQRPGGGLESFTYYHEEHPGEPVNSPRHSRVVQRVDANGNVSRFDYNADGRRIRETRVMDVAGTPTTVELRKLTYDTRGNLTERVENIDPATPQADAATDRTTHYYYDPQGYHLERVVDALGGETRQVWDTDLGEPDRGLIRRVEHDRRAAYPDGEERLSVLAAETGYDVLRRPIAFTDARGSQRLLVRDRGGRVTDEWRFGLDEAGQFTTRRTRFAYDRADRRVQVTDPLNGVTRSEYDLLGHLVKRVDPRGHATRFAYDARGQRIRTVDPTGAVRRIVRDAKGRPVERIDALGNAARMEYDAEGRLVRRIDPEGNETTFTYDANGNRIGVRNARTNAGQVAPNADGFSETREYDELDRLVVVRDALGGEVRYDLDLLGDRTRVTDPAGHATQRGFDRLGRLTSVSDPLGRVEQRSYDSAGNLIGVRDPRGQTVKLYYDFADIEVSAVFSDGTETRLGFDGFGNQVLSRSEAVTYTTRFDALDRPVARTDSRFDSAQRFTWDAAGNLLSLTDLEGGVHQYRYDEAGRLTGISTPDGTEVERHYDARGQRTAQHFGSGASTTWSHDASGRLARLEHRSAAGLLLASRDYVYDANGNRIQAQLQGGGTETYTYDALDRLVQVDYADGSSQLYDYDAVGNRTHENDRGTQRWFHYDAANQLGSISSDASGNAPLFLFLYDANGNTIARCTPSCATWQSYEYDVQDRIVRVQDDTGADWQYTYDAAGRRVSQVSAQGAVEYTWRGGNRVGEYASGALAARYTYGPGLDDLVQVDRGGSTAHAHQDAVGSVLSLSAPSGVELARYDYDAFGSVRSSAGSFQNDLRFAGRALDSNGLLYFRARFYDPASGRFLGEDPLRFDGGINFYTYAANNPVTLGDPNGQVVVNFVAGVVGGTAAVVAYKLAKPDASWQELAVVGGTGFAAGFLIAPAVQAGFAALGAGAATSTLATGGTVGIASDAVTQGVIKGPGDINLVETGIAGAASTLFSVPAAGAAAAQAQFGAAAFSDAAAVGLEVVQGPKAVGFGLGQSALAGQLPQVTTGDVFNGASDLLGRGADAVGDLFGSAPVAQPPPVSVQPPRISHLIK